MTRETTPHAFEVADDTSVVRFEDVTLHQVIEADADGRLLKRVWIEGRIVPKTGHARVTLDVSFDLYAGDDRLGRLRAEGIEIDGEAKQADFVAADDLRIVRSLEVSRLELSAAITTLDRLDAVGCVPRED